jgi:hypothetical protein
MMSAVAPTTDEQKGLRGLGPNSLRRLGFQGKGMLAPVAGVLKPFPMPRLAG